MKKIRVLGMILIIGGLFLGIFGSNLPRIQGLGLSQISQRSCQHQSEIQLALKPGQVAGMISVTPVIGTTSRGIEVMTRGGVVEVVYINGYREKVAAEGAPTWSPYAVWGYSFFLKNISPKDIEIRVLAMNATKNPSITNYDNAGNYHL